MNKFSGKAKVFFTVGSIALILGGMIYWLYRPKTYVAMCMPEGLWLDVLRKFMSWGNVPFVKYYFPDYLWAIALSCGLHLIFRPKICASVLCTVVVVIYGGIYELLQYFSVIGGTGDLWDILMYILAGITVNILNSTYKE